MQPPPPTSSNAFAAHVLAAVPPTIMNSLTLEQRAAINAAVKAAEPLVNRHSVSIRLSIPVPFRRCYLTVLAGRDRRSPGRRLVERRMHPLGTAGNLAFASFLLILLAGLIVLVEMLA